MDLTKDWENYIFSWDDSNVDHNYRIEKRDKIWRILKYGNVHKFKNDYYRVSYKNLHAILSLANQKNIVSTYRSKSFPDINYEDYSNTDHAMSRMRERNITVRNLREAMSNYIYYDRPKKNNWKIMSFIENNRLFVKVDTSTKSNVSMFFG